ncbi:MAG: dihydrolipoyl dehydrogenase [Candidatus Muiribacteriota bacterium]
MYDIAVIGGGPGGYTAAIKAAIHGMNVILFEKEHIGGTCLNRGCIPTKALLASADLFLKIKKASDFGINVEKFCADYKTMFSKKDEIVNKLRKGIHFLIKKRKIKYIPQKAFLKQGKKIITEGGEEFKAEKIILATGSVPQEMPFASTDGDKIINSDHALNLNYIPESAVIIGGGVIGIEFASLWSSFGCKVTIVEMASELIPFADKELAKKLKTSLKKKKIKILTKKKVLNVKKEDNKVNVQIEGNKTINAEKLLIAAGRIPSCDGVDICLEKNKNFIKVNDCFETSAENIYAIGDLVSWKQLAHVASAQASFLIDHLRGKEDKKFLYKHIPSCVYSLPEVSWCGLTEEEAVKENINIKKGYFKFSALGKALAGREEEGFVKIIGDINNNILGVHMLGAKVSELIAEPVTAMASGMKIKEWAEIVKAHPTMSEAIMEAVHDVNEECVHSF